MEENNKGNKDKEKKRTPWRWTDDLIALIVVLCYIFQSVKGQWQWQIHGVPDWGFAFALVYVFGKSAVSGFKEFWKTIQEGQKEIIEEITEEEKEKEKEG